MFSYGEEATICATGKLFTVCELTVGAEFELDGHTVDFHFVINDFFMCLGCLGEWIDPHPETATQPAFSLPPEVLFLRLGD